LNLKEILKNLEYKPSPQRAAFSFLRCTRIKGICFSTTKSVKMGALMHITPDLEAGFSHGICRDGP
jgi:hypothetical protein